MKKLNFVAAAVLAASSFAASAADTFTLTQQDVGTYTFAGLVDNGAFSVDAAFAIDPGTFLFAGSVTHRITSKRDIDFSSVYLVNQDTNVQYQFVQTGYDGNDSENWNLAETLTTGGNYKLHLVGKAILTGGVSTAAFGGEMSVTAVPEPSTYALLLAGLGSVGFVARRRKAA